MAIPRQDVFNHYRALSGDMTAAMRNGGPRNEITRDPDAPYPAIGIFPLARNFEGASAVPVNGMTDDPQITESVSGAGSLYSSSLYGNILSLKVQSGEATSFNVDGGGESSNNTSDSKKKIEERLYYQMLATQAVAMEQLMADTNSLMDDINNTIRRNAAFCVLAGQAIEGMDINNPLYQEAKEAFERTVGIGTELEELKQKMAENKQEMQVALQKEGLTESQKAEIVKSFMETEKGYKEQRVNLYQELDYYRGVQIEIAAGTPLGQQMVASITGLSVEELNSLDAMDQKLASISTEYESLGGNKIYLHLENEFKPGQDSGFFDVFQDGKGDNFAVVPQENGTLSRVYFEGKAGDKSFTDGNIDWAKQNQEDTLFTEKFLDRKTILAQDSDQAKHISKILVTQTHLERESDTLWAKLDDPAPSPTDLIQLVKEFSAKNGNVIELAELKERIGTPSPELQAKLADMMGHEKISVDLRHADPSLRDAFSPMLAYGVQTEPYSDFASTMDPDAPVEVAKVAGPAPQDGLQKTDPVLTAEAKNIPSGPSGSMGA